MPDNGGDIDLYTMLLEFDQNTGGYKCLSFQTNSYALNFWPGHVMSLKSATQGVEITRGEFIRAFTGFLEEIVREADARINTAPNHRRGRKAVAYHRVVTQPEAPSVIVVECHSDPKKPEQRRFEVYWDGEWKSVKGLGDIKKGDRFRCYDYGHLVKGCMGYTEFIAASDPYHEGSLRNPSKHYTIQCQAVPSLKEIKHDEAKP